MNKSAESNTPVAEEASRLHVLLEALRANEARLRLAIQVARLRVWDWNLVTDEVWYPLPGYLPISALEPAGRTYPFEDFVRAIHPDDREVVRRARCRALESGEPYQVEFRVTGADGVERWTETRGAVLHDTSGKPTHMVGISVDITARKQAEQAIREQALRLAEISEREQERIGRDLHDGLGQQLTGLLYHANALREELEKDGHPAAREAGLITRLLEDTFGLARRLAHGLQPVMPEPCGLMSGLDELAITVRKMFRVSCRFVCRRPVLVRDPVAATHLYRITQEAVNNGVRHGKASRIIIALESDGDTVTLRVRNNGRRFEAAIAERRGLGLETMHHRAANMGGSLDVRPGARGGTVVRCSVPGAAMRAEET